MKLLQRINKYLRESAKKDYEWAVEALIKENKSEINDPYFWNRLISHYKLREKIAIKKGINISDYVEKLNKEGIIIQ